MRWRRQVLAVLRSRFVNVVSGGLVFGSCAASPHAAGRTTAVPLFVVIIVSFFVVALTTTPPAYAGDVVDKCIAQSQSAQMKRQRGALVAAAAEFEQCTRPACPSAIRSDCVRTLEETRKELPTFILAAADENERDVLDIEIWIDGTKVLEHPTGRETPIDPGSHTISFVRTSTKERVEVSVLARVREKSRRIIGKFAGAGEAGKPPSLTAPAASSSLPSSSSSSASTDPSTTSLPVRSRPSLALPTGLFVGSAALAGVAVYFQVSGTADVDNLQTRCGSNCSPDQVSETEDRRSTKEWVARGALLGAVLLAAAGIYLLVTQR